MKRKILICLILCLVFTFAVSAEEVEHFLGQPELLEAVEMPEHWSAEALKFCVGNGIIRGRENGLAHLENTSRAETAAMLVRLLGAQVQEPDLSEFKDVKPDAWYYGELAAAVNQGIMKGVSDTALAPNASVTREQVFVMLSRAFGLCASDNERWKQFKDSAEISDYARGAISALAERGYLNGYLDGTVRPGQNITRGELAQMFYGLFTHICGEVQQLPTAGRVLYNGTETIPAGYTLDGNLTVGCGLGGDVILEGLNITGELAVQGVVDGKVALVQCLSSSVSVPAKLTVTSDTLTGKLYACGFGSWISMDAKEVWVSESCTLTGAFDRVNCVQDVLFVNMEGLAEYVRIDADAVTINGKGFCQTVDSYGYNNKVVVSHGTVNEYAFSVDYENALSVVETVDVWDTVTKDTYLYSSSGLYNVIRKLPAGTKLRHHYLQENASAAAVYTEDGTFGYVPVSCIQIPKEMDIAKTDYNEATMEGFVDKKEYSSSTDYLLWVSLKTQTVNLFTGSKGNWQLVKSMPCASGTTERPTVKGEFKVRYKYWEWNFTTYKVRYVTGFYDGYAFHSRTYNPSFTQMLDPTINKPASHGCLRMLDEDCKYIFDNIPYGTTVVVY